MENNAKRPDFYIIATGKTTSVKDFVKKVFKKLNLDIKLLKINKKLLRPVKNSALTGDFSKAKKKINYKVKNNMNSLIDIMLRAELKKYNE